MLYCPPWSVHPRHGSCTNRVSIHLWRPGRSSDYDCAVFAAHRSDSLLQRFSRQQSPPDPAHPRSSVKPLSAFGKADYDKVRQALELHSAGRLLPLRIAPDSSVLSSSATWTTGRGPGGLSIVWSIWDGRDDPSLLRPLASSMLTASVRDRTEHVRIAAYTALAELGLPETRSILEDGLLDTSSFVRARAAEGSEKPGLAAKSGPLRRALRRRHADRPHCGDERAERCEGDRRSCLDLSMSRALKMVRKPSSPMRPCTGSANRTCWRYYRRGDIAGPESAWPPWESWADSNVPASLAVLSPRRVRS